MTEADPILLGEQELKLRALEHVLLTAVRNFDIEPHDYWPIYHIARQGLLADWRAERLAALPPQAEETIPPLLFIEVEHIPTGFQDEDTLAGEIKYVTDWPESPGGRWSDMGEY